MTYDRALQLDELADAIAQDQDYLNGLSQVSPASPPDVARLVAYKRKCRGLAASAFRR